MVKGFPDKKISRAVRKCLKENDFTFERCNGHAIFKHSPSGGMFPVKLSREGGNGFFSGDKYIIDLIKKFVQERGCTFQQ